MDGSGIDQAGVEVWAGGVSLWECDFQDHMNVRFYVAKAMEGLAGLAAALGMPDAFAPSARATLKVRDLYVRYIREAHAGALLSMTGAVLSVSDSEARLLLVLRHPTGEPSAAFQLVARHVSPDDGRVLPWTDDFLARARALTVELPRYAAARTLSLDDFETTASLARAQELGLQRVALNIVSPADCDVFGGLRFNIFLGRIADGMPGLVKGRKPDDESARRLGGAAVEYRLVYFDQPRVGDRIEVRSGVVQFTARFRQTIHWLLNPDTGRPWGVASHVGVSFDLDTRKLASFSPEHVAAHQDQVVPGLAL